MTCREVEHFWELRLDGVRPGALPEATEGLPAELAAHLSVCPRCRTRTAGFSTLAQAIGGLEAPRPSAGLPARVLAAVRADREPVSVPMPTRPGRWRSAGPLLARRFAVAAAVVLVVFGIRAIRSPREGGGVPDPGRLPPQAAPVVTVEQQARPLTETVAEVAEVTVAIARRTSEPAARLGREMLESATEAPSLTEAAVPTEGEGAADRMVKGIGTRLEAGVKPFSQPTRSAFSFLLPSFPPAEDSEIPERGV
ncbi:hypothetical protein AB1L88_00855 [Tautonia sp. JC769]|uniref:hypothetical protein n=1 Tax=Tautonia sp. JC769 TaxID=3232135 RepID=UPI003458ECB5